MEISKDTADVFSEDDLAELKETFNLFDKNGDGLITKDELGIAMRSLGLSPTEAELCAFVNDPDGEGNATIDFQEFTKIMSRRSGNREPEDELREAFSIIDKEGTGTISGAQLRHIMTTFGEKLSDEEVEEMIRDADTDGDGMINMEEFIEIMIRS